MIFVLYASRINSPTAILLLCIDKNKFVEQSVLLQESRYMTDENNDNAIDRFVISDCKGTPSKVLVDFNRDRQINTEDIDFKFINENSTETEILDGTKESDSSIYIEIPKEKIPTFVDWLEEKKDYWEIEFANREHSASQAYQNIISYIKEKSTNSIDSKNK